MLKRFFTYFVLAVTIAQSSGAHATNLDTAFQSLTGTSMATVSGPGFYNSQTRNVFIAGGAEVRFPPAQRNISMLSITPPNLSAGCGGISAHFGGFSFISGAQIEQLIKNIGQNAVGMVVSVVIKTLCPICDAVIQSMMKLAAEAARLAINSCAIATNLTSMIGADKNPEAGTPVCGKNVAVKGKSEDYLAAVNGISAACVGMQKVMAETQKIIAAAEGRNPDGTPSGKPVDPADVDSKRDIEFHNLYGNTTWNLLNAVYGPAKNVDDTKEAGQDDLRNRMLLMNVLGFELTVAPKPGAPAGATTSMPHVGKNPTLASRHLFDLFMCGAAIGPSTPSKTTEGMDSTPSTRLYCKSFYAGSADPKALGQGQDGGAAYTVWECAKDDIEKCERPIEVVLGESKILKGRGFLPQTEILLNEAVEAVRENRAAGFSAQFLELIKQVNFPIYQAVNAAAVYPASTHDLMSSMSILVAESLTYARLERMLQFAGRNTSDVKVNKELAQRVYAAVEAMNKGHLAQKESYGRMMAAQEGMVQSIRQINLAVQKQVLTPNLLGNHKYSSQVAASIAKQQAK